MLGTAVLYKGTRDEPEMETCLPYFWQKAMDEWKRRALGYLPFQKGEKSKTGEGNFQHPAPKMGSVPKDDYGLLKWKDYHVTVASTFKMLKDEEDFLDVTLVCDEDSQISAHKVLCEKKEHVLFLFLFEERDVE